MSFSLEIKRELMEPVRRRQSSAQARGFLQFLRRLDTTGVSFTSENRELCGMFGLSVRTLLGNVTRIAQAETVRSGKTVYTASLPAQADRDRLLALLSGATGGALSPEEIGPYLGGVFLACGSMSDPEKAYHLELVTGSEALCRELAALLEEQIPGVKLTTRRALHIAYYKDRTQIEDLLTLMGASKASLAMIDVEMIKEVRNRANRVTNCETANIDKTVSAAAGQLADIALILERRGLDSLPENLRELALLRRGNPELSLRELAALCSEPVSRSGLHHRLEKLGRIAEEIRAEEAVC